MIRGQLKAFVHGQLLSILFDSVTSSVLDGSFV
jgi:hypothetical protein